MYVLISGYWYALINCIIANMYMCYLSNPNCSSVYRTKILCTWSRVLSKVSVSARGYYNNLHTKTSLRCRSSLSVGRLAIQSSLENDASVCAIFVTHELKSTNLKCVTSVSVK